MNRPVCQFGGCGGCLAPAAWVVTRVHDYKSRLSCDEHKESWNENGRFFCWLSRLAGYLEEKSFEEVVRDRETHPLHEAVVAYKAAKAMAADFDRTGMWL